MWTPRRILILTLAFVVFFIGYFGYAFTSIGRIDGLPPLPEECWPNPGPTEALTPIVRPPSTIEKKLRQAFGDNCPELTRPIRLELHSKNMVLAAGQFQIVRDGRVCLAPLSMAFFSKDRGQARF